MKELENDGSQWYFRITILAGELCVLMNSSCWKAKVFHSDYSSKCGLGKEFLPVIYAGFARYRCVLGFMGREWAWSGVRGPSATGRHGAGAQSLHTHSHHELIPTKHTNLNLYHSTLLLKPLKPSRSPDFSKLS